MNKEKMDPKVEEAIENSEKCVQSPDKKAPQSDVYSDTKCVLEDSGVAIPTEESVEDAKEWVDDENVR